MSEHQLEPRADIRLNKLLHEPSPPALDKNRLELRFAYLAGLEPRDYCPTAVDRWAYNGLLSKYIFHQTVGYNCQSEVTVQFIYIVCSLTGR